MIDIRALDALELDGLREVANIGAAHAATALSQMTNRRISVTIPVIRIVRLEDVPEMTGDADEAIAAVLMRVLGDAPGRTVQIFPADSASRLAGMLLGREQVPFPAGFGDLERSLLNEVGNIVVGACLNALSEFLGMVLIMSVPALAIDKAGAILSASYLGFGDTGEYVLCIDTQLYISERSEPLRAHFLLIPETESLGAILRAMNLR
ncbi:MAG TPA: chemotaxis protein CheC [Longimicrobiales bacterium]|nr:chemotaxis protein CheC [Longimicrobiales bacterium]